MFWSRGTNRFVWIGAVFLGTLLMFASAISTNVMALGGADQQDYAEVYSRDVFVIVGSTLRNPDATTQPDAPLFSDSGVSLELTWGDWQRISATSTARVQGGGSRARTDVRIHLTGLIPGGVYSIFYGTLIPDSENPLCPGVERTLPLTAVRVDQPQPDASSFIAGVDGTAAYRGRIDGNVFNALQVFYTIIYHFDGQTYDPLPNRGEFLTQGSNCRSSFGQDAMRQMIIFQKS